MAKNTYPGKGRLRRAVALATATGVALVGASLVPEHGNPGSQKADADELVEYLRDQFGLPEKGAPAEATVFVGTIAVGHGNTVVIYHNPLVTETPTDLNRLVDDRIVVEDTDNDNSGEIEAVDLPGIDVQVMPEDPKNPYRTLTLRLQSQKGGEGQPLYEMVECAPSGNPIPNPLVLGTIDSMTSYK